MSGQKGQSLVEFAFIIPFFFAMCFGMIYGGILFMDYLQYNNSARIVARAISLTADKTERNKIANDFVSNNPKYVKPLTNLYKRTPKKPEITANDVTVEVELTLNEENLPAILKWINFPPKELKPIKVIMPLEVVKE